MTMAAALSQESSLALFVMALDPFFKTFCKAATPFLQDSLSLSENRGFNNY